MDVAGRGNVGDSATYLYINEVLIRSAKVAVIAVNVMLTSTLDSTLNSLRTRTRTHAD